jgi:hypothetical protein
MAARKTGGAIMTYLQHDMQPDMQHKATLDPEHWQQLTVGSAIAPEIIDERGYRTIHSKHEWKTLDYKLLERQIRTPGIGFPVYRLGNPNPHAMILRPDNPRTSRKDGREKPVKYEYPAGVSPCLDVLPSYREELKNPATDLWITEGAKKADSLATEFNTTIVPVNINGVWAWRGTNTYGGKLVLPDLDEVAINSRKIKLAFDSDVVRNLQVLNALQRFGYLLEARGAAEILVLILPQDGDEKLGVDDALALGWTQDQLCAHLVPLGQAISVGREKLCRHPETGKVLYLPAGYINTGKSIARVDRNEPHIIYPGQLIVSATGVDLQTEAETMTIRFNGRGDKPVEVTAPRRDLAKAKGVIDHLADRGAAVSDSNARDVAKFLTDFAYENREALPHRPHTNRLGLFETGLVLPSGSIGFDSDVRHLGKHTIRVGTDHEVYKRVLAEALTWQNASAFWGIFSLSLASPAIARSKPRRNPAVYLGGISNSGKTTAAQSAIGVWGDPTRGPLRLEAGRTTRAGILQTLEELSGLPLFIDEAHTTRDPRDLEATVYQFANGEAYTRGGPDGKTRGGEPLGGSLILAGEALPEFRHAGSNNRVLWIDVDQFPPLGCEPGSREGSRRAELLEQAWTTGAGLLGIDIARAMWDDWPAFTAGVQKLQSHSALKSLQAWKHPLTIAARALDVTLHMLGVTVPLHFMSLLAQWVEMLEAGKERTDPAADAWEQLVTMLVQAEEVQDGNWTVAKLQHQLIAARYGVEDIWRIPTGTPQFKERVGKSAVQLYGSTWLKNKWIEPGENNEPTPTKSLPGRKLARVLLVPAHAIEHNDVEE